MTTWLGAFGGPIPKQLQLWGNCRFLPVLRRQKPESDLPATLDHYYVRDFIGSVTGMPGLEGTAAYTPEFAHALLSGYMRSLPTMRAELWLAPDDDDNDSSSSVEVDNV